MAQRVNRSLRSLPYARGLGLIQPAGRARPQPGLQPAAGVRRWTLQKSRQRSTYLRTAIILLSLTAMTEMNFGLHSAGSGRLARQGRPGRSTYPRTAVDSQSSQPAVSSCGRGRPRTQMQVVQSFCASLYHLSRRRSHQEAIRQKDERTVRSTFNPQPSTLNFQLSTLNLQHRPPPVFVTSDGASPSG